MFLEKLVRSAQIQQSGLADTDVTCVRMYLVFVCVCDRVLVCDRYERGFRGMNVYSMYYLQ